MKEVLTPTNVDEDLNKKSTITAPNGEAVDLNTVEETKELRMIINQGGKNPCVSLPDVYKVIKRINAIVSENEVYTKNCAGADGDAYNPVLDYINQEDTEGAINFLKSAGILIEGATIRTVNRMKELIG